MIQNNMRADAKAIIKGGDGYSDIKGEVLFFQEKCSVLVAVTVSHLPRNETGFYGFHIHEGDSCGGEKFELTGGHYNPKQAPHPMHGGDLPPLLYCSGNAYMQVKTDRFSVKDIIGKTVIIHSGTDDFKTQPSGSAGEKIACGKICKT